MTPGRAIADAPPSCSLSRSGLVAQRERYRLAGVGAKVLERSSRRLRVEVDGRVADGAVEELVAVELECCPFFGLEWKPAERQLEVSVSRPEDEPALGAIACALGLE